MINAKGNKNNILKVGTSPKSGNERFSEIMTFEVRSEWLEEQWEELMKVFLAEGTVPST